MKIAVVIDTDLKDLILGYLENRRKDIQEILLSLQSGNYEKIRIIGHSMKGSGSGYGFEKITEIGRNLEDAAKSQEETKIREQITQLVFYLDNLEISFS